MLFKRLNQWKIISPVFRYIYIKLLKYILSSIFIIDQSPLLSKKSIDIVGSNVQLM